MIQQKLPINSVEVREVGENSLTISESGATMTVDACKLTPKKTSVSFFFLF